MIFYVYFLWVFFSKNIKQKQTSENLFSNFLLLLLLKFILDLFWKKKFHFISNIHEKTYKKFILKISKNPLLYFCFWGNVVWNWIESCFILCETPFFIILFSQRLLSIRKLFESMLNHKYFLQITRLLNCML